MKAAKWREFTEEELQQKARELNEEIFNLRFQLSMGMAKNPSRLGQARRDLARAKTILRERGVIGVVTAAAAPAPVVEAPAPTKPRRRTPKAATAKKRAATPAKTRKAKR